MKHFLLLLVVIPLTTIAQQQTKPKDSISNSQLAIGVIVCPEIGYRALTAPDGGTANTLISTLNNEETSKFDYSVGLNFAIDLSKHLTLETGAQLSDQGYGTQSQASYIGTAYYRFNYYYLDMPLELNIIPEQEGEQAFFISLGVHVSALLTYTDTEYYTVYNQTQSSNVNNGTVGLYSIGLSGIVGFGYRHYFSSNGYIKFEPFFRRALVSDMGGSIHEFLFSGGLYVGIYLK